MTLAAAVAVAVAVAVASAITYVVVRGELRGQVDDSLRSSARDLSGDRTFVISAGEAAPGSGLAPGPLPQHMPLPAPVARGGLVLPAPPLSDVVVYAQVVQPDGRVVRAPQARFELPVSARARAIARRGSGSYFSDVRIGGVETRVYTRALADGAALQVARPLDEVDDVLSRLGLVLVLVSFGGVVVAVGLALVVTRASMKPVADLSDAAEHVARTRDLSRRIDAGSADELGRLAASFNTMLAALEQSMRQQRQLVADASHELRTPLTSLRTNVEILARSGAAPDAERERLLGSVVGQLEELTALVGDLVDLAREREPDEFEEDLRLDALVREVVERFRRRHPGREYVLDAEPCVVHGVAPRLGRAVANLLDNAEKWSPSGEPIAVSVHGGEVAVRDHGPGIDEADLPFVFDRFFRAPAARGMTGSGLGLAIVRQVAETHGGVAVAERAPGGGTITRLRLPARAAGSTATTQHAPALARS